MGYAASASPCPCRLRLFSELGIRLESPSSIKCRIRILLLSKVERIGVRDPHCSATSSPKLKNRSFHASKNIRLNELPYLNCIMPRLKGRQSWYVTQVKFQRLRKGLPNFSARVRDRQGVTPLPSKQGWRFSRICQVLS